MFKKHTGFTLIEMMVVVSIIAILAGIAYPAYTSHVDRSRRAEAMSALVEMSGDLERYFTVMSAYTTSVDGAFPNVGLGRTDVFSETGRYTLTIASPNLSTYTITATPRNWIDNLCGSFTLTNTGVREVSGDFDGDNSDGDSVDGPNGDVADVADTDDINACWR